MIGFAHRMIENAAVFKLLHQYKLVLLDFVVANYAMLIIL